MTEQSCCGLVVCQIILRGIIRAFLVLGKIDDLTRLTLVINARSSSFEVCCCVIIAFFLVRAMAAAGWPDCQAITPLYMSQCQMVFVACFVTPW